MMRRAPFTVHRSLFRFLFFSCRLRSWPRPAQPRPTPRWRTRRPAPVDPDHRRPQRPGLGDPHQQDGAVRCRRLRPAADDTRTHRLRAPRGGAGRRTVLVDLRAGRGEGQRLREDPARGVRHRAALHREVPGQVHARAHGGRHRAANKAGKIARLLGMEGGHAIENSLGALRDVLRPRRALHDAHAQRDARLGRCGARHAGAQRAHRVRRGGRARDEPARDDGGPVARVARRHERCPRRHPGAGHLLPLVGARPGGPSRATCPTRSWRGCRRTAAS